MQDVVPGVAVPDPVPYAVADLRYAIRLARSSGFLRPANTILVPGMYLEGHSSNDRPIRVQQFSCRCSYHALRTLDEAYNSSYCAPLQPWPGQLASVICIPRCHFSCCWSSTRRGSTSHKYGHRASQSSHPTMRTKAATLSLGPPPHPHTQDLVLDLLLQKPP